MLVSAGANAFASMRGLDCCSAESLISPRAQREWDKWKRELDIAQSNEPPLAALSMPPSATTSSELDGLRDRQDTVGAVAWDAAGNLAAGVSRYLLPGLHVT